MSAKTEGKGVAIVLTGHAITAWKAEGARTAEIMGFLNCKEESLTTKNLMAPQADGTYEKRC